MNATSSLENSPTHQDFAAFLARTRIELWMTCPQIARRLRVSTASYRYWEGGKGFPMGGGEAEIRERLVSLLANARAPWKEAHPIAA